MLLHLLKAKGFTVTAHKNIQSLIHDLERLLARADSPLPWSTPSDVASARSVLEEVRHYLSERQHGEGEAPVRPETEQSLAQSAKQELNRLRADWLDTLQADLVALRQQRESLVQDIRQLESKRQNLTQQRSPLSQENAGSSLTQMLGQLDVRLARIESAVIRDQGAEPGHPAMPMSEPLQQLQAHSDRQIVALDASQQTIFATLQRNLRSYEQSLSQGLERMHHLGVQGEMLVAALVDRITQQLAQASVSSNTTAFDAANAEDESTATEEPTPSPEAPIEVPDADWELLDGLDWDDSDFDLDEDDGLDTFIQLDVGAPVALPSVEAIGEVGQSNGTLTQAGSESSPETTALQSGDFDTHHPELQALYESLFGRDALSGTPVQKETETAKSETLAAHFSLEDDWSEAVEAELPEIELPEQLASQDEGNPNPSTPRLEASLFSGLSDPATEANEATQTPPREFAQSWEAFLFEDPVTPPPARTQKTPQGSHPLSTQNGVREREGVETISALTDLFEEMGLSEEAAAEDVLETESQEDGSEDAYISASPGEDLLATDRLEAVPEIDISLEPESLQHLREDLHSFEETQAQESDRLQDATEADVGETPRDEHHLPELESEEFLAEDWEEFTSDDRTEEDAELRSLADESEASDFDPDLFPPEALELHQDQGTATSDSQDFLGFEEQTLSEMQWDESFGSVPEETATASEPPQAASDEQSSEPSDEEENRQDDSGSQQCDREQRE